MLYSPASGVEKRLSRLAHNQEIARSSRAPRTNQWGKPMPRIEGNFNIGRIVVEDGDYLTVWPATPDDVLFYVSDKGERYKIEFPVEGEVQRENWTDYVRLAPVESAAVA